MRVNEEFKQEIKRVFKSGFEESFSAGFDEGRWNFKDKSSLKGLDEEEFFVLTMSSQLFRIIILMHFTRSDISRNCIAEVLNVNASNLDDEKFYDYLGEVGNSFLGAIKRDIGRTVPSLGMSTPNRLNKGCLKYMTNFDTDFESHAVSEFDNNEIFYSSIYLIADEELNISLNKAHAEEELDSGELEFF